MNFGGGAERDGAEGGTNGVGTESVGSMGTFTNVMLHVEHPLQAQQAQTERMQRSIYACCPLCCQRGNGVWKFRPEPTPPHGHGGYLTSAGPCLAGRWLIRRQAFMLIDTRLHRKRCRPTVECPQPGRWALVPGYLMNIERRNVGVRPQKSRVRHLSRIKHATRPPPRSGSDALQASRPQGA